MDDNNGNSMFESSPPAVYDFDYITRKLKEKTVEETEPSKDLNTTKDENKNGEFDWTLISGMYHYRPFRRIAETE